MLPKSSLLLFEKKRERENKEKERKWKQDQQSWTTLKAVQNHFIPLGRKKWRRASNMTAPGLLLLPLLLLLVQFASAVERNTWLSPRDSPRWVRRNTASFGSGPIWFLDCRAKLNDSPQKRGQRCSLPRLQACYLLRERKKKDVQLRAWPRRHEMRWATDASSWWPTFQSTAERDEIKTAMKEESPRNGHEFAHWTIWSSCSQHGAAAPGTEKMSVDIPNEARMMTQPHGEGCVKCVWERKEKKKKTKREREKREKKLFTHTVYAARPSVIWAGSATAGVHTPRTHARQ